MESVGIRLQEALRPIILNQHNVGKPFGRSGIEARVELLDDIRLSVLYDVDFYVRIDVRVGFFGYVHRGDIKCRVPGPYGNFLGVRGGAFPSRARIFGSRGAGGQYNGTGQQNGE
ncbi:hypothetical protein D1872_246750 [compost metagenome]